MTGPTIDARGLRCPWPVLRLARAMRESDAVTILADDPAASDEIAALCMERGWQVARIASAFSVSVRRVGELTLPLPSAP